METDKHTIAPGDVYKYRCYNDQGYGYMIPVKTSIGWDFIDTYHLDIPWTNKGEIDVDASIRRINELGRGEHDRFVRRTASNFYSKNVLYDAQEVPSDLQFMFNLNDYEPLPHRECSDYDVDDTIMFVPLYREQNFNWDSGIALGLCFVRKGAKKSQVNEFRNLLSEANNSITEPQADNAAFLLGEIKKKLRELENAGLWCQAAAHKWIQWYGQRRGGDRRMSVTKRRMRDAKVVSIEDVSRAFDDLCFSGAISVPPPVQAQLKSILIGNTMLRASQSAQTTGPVAREGGDETKTEVE